MTAPAALHTPEEAALLVGLSPRTLRNKAGAGLIPHSRPAGARVIRFSDQDIADIQAMGHVAPAAAGLLPRAPIPRPRRPRAA